ncbi:MAG: class I SAM-dependent rRNA methyltransferase [Myxococcota bacterium]
MSAITVDGYSEGWLRRGFPWVYPKEVTAGRARPGAMVGLIGPTGAPLGSGIADDGFVAVRRFRADDGPIDAGWIAGVLDRAAALRDVVVPPETDGFRLCNAECDGLPGIRLDWWSPFAVITIDRPSLAGLVPHVVAWLRDRRGPRGVVLAYRRDPRDPAWDPPEPALVDGHPPRGPVRVRERGTRFDVLPLTAPDVGLYADMREVRAWLEPHWGGTRVLNTFAYTGAFSVVAARLGASEVVSVDLARPALDRCEQNFAANELQAFPHEVVCADTFRALDRFRRTGRRFERVILDPPAFSHGDGARFTAEKDYPRLVAAAARVLDDGGWLVAASNQGDLSPKVFDGLLIDGLRKAGCQAQMLHAAGQAPDFPSATWFPEGRYLKVRVLRITTPAP